MNNEYFVVDNGSNREQAEDVLKELEDFSPVGLQDIRIEITPQLKNSQQKGDKLYIQEKDFTLYFCITSLVKPYLKEDQY